MRKQGKLTQAQISKDRHTPVMTAGDLVKSVETPDTRAEMWERKRARISTDTFAYRNRAGNRLFRNPKTGQLFVVRDLLDEYFAAVFKCHEYTADELMKIGQPNDEGWRDAEAYPLGQTKARLLELMNEPEKWLHFNVSNVPSSRIDLFFSPKKDKWMYVEVNPHTAAVQVSQIMSSKALAEFKRKNKLLIWRKINPGSLPVIPI